MANKEFNAKNGVSVGTTPTVVIDSTGAVLTNAATATKLLNSRTISISGDVVATGSFDGSGNLDLAATIQANSVALGTDTTGNYMINVAAGTGVSVSHTQSEGSTATVSIGQAIGTTDSPTFANVTLTGELRGPASFVIDPSAVGDNTGTVVIKGNLQVDGTTTTINSTTLTVDDLVLTLGGDTAPASDDTFDKGIEYRWYDTQARVGFFGFDRSTGKLTFIPQSTLSSGVYSGTTGEIDAKLDWSNVLNKPTIDNTTYNHLAVTTTGGALLRLNSSGAVNDDVKFASGTNVTVAYTDDNTITISSSYTDTNTTYSIKASSQTGGAGLDLDAGGSGSGTDTVKILGSGGTTVTQTDADTITISSTSVGAGALSVATKSAGATNTDVTLELSGAYNANTSTDRTIKAVVGPALTALATLMATAGPGFIKRTAVADTFSVDTSTYITGNQTITLTGDITGSGATSIVTTLANSGVTAGSGYNTFTVDSKGRITTASTTSYLSSYSETDTLATVTGRGASTSTNITLSGGTTNLGHTTTNYITTSDNGSIIVRTKDQTTRQSALLNLQTGNSTYAGSYTGPILIKTGNATGGSGAYAGDISMYPGTSDGAGALVSIYGGESYGGTTSSGGSVTIRGGDSSTTTGTTTAYGGHVYIYGGSITSFNNFTKYSGSVYIEGGGAAGFGTITYGTVNIGRTNASSTYGTSAVYIGNSLITTTINGTVKLPEVGTSGFVKLGTGGQLSADTNTYALSSHTHSYLSSNSSTTYSGGLLKVTMPSGSIGTANETNTLQIFQDTTNTDAFMTFHISTDYAVHFGLDGTTNDLFVGGWSMGAAKYKVWHANNDGASSGLDADLLDGNHASAFALAGHTHSYLSSESDTLATVTGRGASTSTAVTFNGNVSVGTSANLSFGSQTRQMINLWSTSYGIGVQSSTLYFRTGGRFSWHTGGAHSDSENDPGSGGVAMMTLDSSSKLTVTGNAKISGGTMYVGSDTTYVTRNSTTGCMEFYV